MRKRYPKTLAVSHWERTVTFVKDGSAIAYDPLCAGYKSAYWFVEPENRRVFCVITKEELEAWAVPPFDAIPNCVPLARRYKLHVMLRLPLIVTNFLDIKIGDKVLMDRVEVGDGFMVYTIAKGGALCDSPLPL